MGVQVAWDYNAWVAGYLQFADPHPPQGTVQNVVFPLAEIYCRNDGGGPVSTAETQTQLLNLMVAHLVQLYFGASGIGPAPPVGRLASATEGSVSVSFDMPGSPSAAWFNQTPWGAMFWQATTVYRRMRYIPGPSRRGLYFNPWPNR